MKNLLVVRTPAVRGGSAIAFAALLACCSQQAQRNDTIIEASDTNAHAAAREVPVGPPAPGEPGGLPDDRTPIVEGPIDPKSAQGAGQVLQTYFALAEQGKFAEANSLWSDGATRLDLTSYQEIHANIGGAGNMEGAAGSSYVDYPVQLYGRTKDGKEFSTRGSVTLRRVNDVPGSTAEQRNWHIYKIDLPQPGAPPS